jgi:hypothetical protein
LFATNLREKPLANFLMRVVWIAGKWRKIMGFLKRYLLTRQMDKDTSANWFSWAPLYVGWIFICQVHIQFVGNIRH